MAGKFNVNIGINMSNDIEEHSKDELFKETLFNERQCAYERMVVAEAEMRTMRQTVFGVHQSLVDGTLDAKDIYSLYYLMGESVARLHMLVEEQGILAGHKQDDESSDLPIH